MNSLKFIGFVPLIAGMVMLYYSFKLLLVLIDINAHYKYIVLVIFFISAIFVIYISYKLFNNIQLKKIEKNLAIVILVISYLIFAFAAFVSQF